MRISRTVLDRRTMLALMIAGLAPVGCGDPAAGTVTPEAEHAGAPTRLKRLEQLKKESAGKKKGGH